MRKTKQIDLLMYDTMTNKTPTYFIKENGTKREVSKQDILNTIKHYYKLAHEGKIKLGEGYYVNGNAHLAIKELYVTPIE